MISRDELRRQAEQLMEDLSRGFQAGHLIEPHSRYRVGIGYRSTRTLGLEDVRLPVRWGAIVGLDIREWTRRDHASQLIVATIANSCVVHAVDILHEHGLFTKDDPLFALPTGDGVYMVFDAGEDLEADGAQVGHEEREAVTELVEAIRKREEAQAHFDPKQSKTAATLANAITAEKEAKERFDSVSGKPSGGRIETKNAERERVEAIGKALSFILILNTLLLEQNARRPAGESLFREEKEMSVWPIYPRFSLTLDRLLPCLDANKKLNVIGPGMVTCGRLLSADHGNHFLVHDRLLHECDPHGGLARVASRAGVGDWDAHFHCAELPDAKIKSGSFRYADVFGHYMDTPLLRLHGVRSIPPMEYHIGSHDMLVLDRPK